LGIKIVRQSVEDKLAAYVEIKSKAHLSDDQVAYMGDDIIDLPILAKVGLAIAVKDSWPGLGPFVDLVTEMGGGRGAVREVAELVLKAQGKWPIH
jgi:3-deoxy-D-manno-octulosonate 8-phosphate phosphatase (KDO 8-P phosphatase)